MNDPIRPDVLRKALDEAEAIIEGLEQVDAALGAYLVRCLAEPAGHARRSSPVGSAGWYRERILAWCRAPSVRTQFVRDAVERTRMAVPALSDEELRLLVADLVERGGGRAEATHRAMASSPPARPTPRQDGAAGHPRPLRRSR
jgi:hypothetical protein